MIERWFNETFTVSRRDDAVTWAASPFVDVCSVYGYCQPSGGALGTKNGAVNSSDSFTLYCSAVADIEEGDRVTDTSGADYIVIYSQDMGIVNMAKHQEVSMERERV